MALPLWLFLVLSSWSFQWYYGISILAAELLLFYGVSVIAGIILHFRSIPPSLCPECGARLILNGSYFDNKEKPNLEDIVLSILYVGVNVGFWLFLLAKT